MKTEESQNSNSLRIWQNNMLPLMKRLVIGLVMFFFIASCIQLLYLHRTIQDAPTLNIETYLLNLSKEIPPAKRSFQDVKYYALVLMENNALARRHHQANVLLMSRVWVRYLGFVTGMILAMVGAIFILGKLQEPISELASKIDKAEVTLKSNSPGIILAVLGVILMLATILTHHNIEVRDVAVYTQMESKKPQLDGL